jgi:putative peptidoglycan lipid II flippase
MFATRLPVVPGIQAVYDEPDEPRVSRAQLAENGATLGPPHSQHDDIANIGRGGFSLWNGYLRFSSSDNSDPRSNNHTYTLTYEIKAAPSLITAFCALTVLLLISLTHPAAFRSQLVTQFAHDAHGRFRTYISTLWSATLDRAKFEQIILASVIIYLLGVATGGASFIVQHSHGMLAIAVGRGVLVIQLAAAPLAAIVAWSDPQARRYFVGSALASAAVATWIAATHVKQFGATPADKALLLSFWQMVGYGTLFVHLRSDKVVRASIGIILFLICSLCLLQSMGLGPHGLDAGRSSALYDNPNIAALAIGLLCFGLSSSLMFQQSAWWINLSALAVASTLSRSGVAAFGIAFFLIPEFRRFRTKVIVGAVSLLASLVAITAIIPESRLPESLFAAKATLTDCLQVIAHLAHGTALGTPHDGTVVASSGLERIDLLLRGWDALWAAPLTGRGLNFAQHLAPHNSFVLFGLAFGIAGILIPLVWNLPGLYISSRNQLARGAFIFIALTFSHDMLLLLPLVACGIYCVTSGSCKAAVTVPGGTYHSNSPSGGLLATWLSHSKFWKSAAVVSVLSAASMVAGFARTAVIAAKFGASSPVDAYYLALIIPVYVTTLLASLLQVSFLPFYSRSLVSDRSKADKIRSTVFWVLAGSASCLAALFAEFAPVALPLISADNVVVGGLAISIAPMIAATFLTNLLADYFGFILNGHKRFAIAAAAPALNAIVSSFALFLSNNTPFALAETLVLGALVQLLLNAMALFVIRAGFSLKDFRFTEVFNPLSRLIAPALPGVAFSATSLAILNASAARLGPGALSVFGYAWRLYSVPSQVFVLSIGTILLPHFSQLVEVNDRRRLNEDLVLLAKIAWLGSLLVLAACYLYGDTLIYAVLGWGHFSRGDASSVNLALLGFLLSLFFFSYGTFLARLLAAQYKNLFVSASSLITLAVIVTCAFSFQGWHSLLRVSLSLSFGYAAATVFMQVCVSRFLSIDIRWLELILFGGKSLVAIGVAAAASVSISLLAENPYIVAALGASTITLVLLLLSIAFGLIEVKGVWRPARAGRGSYVRESGREPAAD